MQKQFLLVVDYRENKKESKLNELCI